MWSGKRRPFCLGLIVLWVDALRPEQNGHHADYIFKNIFLIEKAGIVSNISVMVQLKISHHCWHGNDHQATMS